MARIFALDVLECPRCGGRMRILAAIEDPSVARKILDCLGLPSRLPPVAPARRNRRLEIAFFCFCCQIYSISSRPATPTYLAHGPVQFENVCRICNPPVNNCRDGCSAKYCR